MLKCYVYMYNVTLVVYWFVSVSKPLWSSGIIPDIINVPASLSTDTKVSLKIPAIIACRAEEDNHEAKLRNPCVSLTCAPSPSLLREGMSGLLSRAELGHLFHIWLHAQSRWVTAVIGIRESDTLQRLSLLRCSNSSISLMPSVKHLMMSKSQKKISAKAHTAEVSVHQFWNVNEPLSFRSAPSFCWMWLHLLQFAAFFQDFT